MNTGICFEGEKTPCLKTGQGVNGYVAKQGMHIAGKKTKNVFSFIFRHVSKLYGTCIVYNTCNEYAMYSRFLQLFKVDLHFY